MLAVLGLSDPFAPYQGWVPTYGCLRMQNADGEELSRMIINAGNGMQCRASLSLSASKIHSSTDGQAGTGGMG